MFSKSGICQTSRLRGGGSMTGGMGGRGGASSSGRGREGPSTPFEPRTQPNPAQNPAHRSAATKAMRVSADIGHGDERGKRRSTERLCCQMVPHVGKETKLGDEGASGEGGLESPLEACAKGQNGTRVP